MTFVRFLAIHALELAAIALWCLAAGTTILGRIRFRSPAETIFFRMTFGIGGAGTVALLLGLVRLLERPFVVAALAAIALPAAPRLWREARAAFRGASPRVAALAALVAAATAAWLLPILAKPFYPPTGFDSTMYHLPVAKADVARHALVYVPTIRVAFFPQLTEVTDAVVLLLFDDVAAQLLHLLMLAVTALGAFALAERCRGTRAGVWAAALCFSSAALSVLGTAVGTDLPSALFVLAGAYALVRWLEADGARDAAIAGAAFGFGAATKYVGLFPLALGGIVVATRSLRRRTIRAVSAFGLLAAIIAAPWYARTFVLTGNPVYPFAIGIFGTGHGPLSPQEMRGYQQQLTPRSEQDRSLSGLARAPFAAVPRIASSRDRSPLALAVLGLLGAVGFALRRGPLRLVALFALAYWIFWAVSFPEIRYLDPAVPLLAVCAGAGIEAAAGKAFARLPALAGRLAVTALAAALSLPAVAEARKFERAAGPIPSTPADRDRYLSRAIDGYAALRFLGPLPDGARVYLLYAHNLGYYVPGGYIGDWYGVYRYRRVVRRLASAPAVSDELRQMNAPYLLVSTRNYRRFHRKPFVPPKGPGLRLLYSDDRSALYAVEPAGDIRPGGGGSGRLEKSEVP